MLLISRIKKYEDLFRYLTEIEADGAAIIATDKNLDIVFWNKMAENLFGWKSEEILKKESSSVRNKVLKALTRDNVMKSIEEEGSWFGETHCTNKDGSRIIAWIYLGILWDDHKKFNGIFGVYRKITTSEELKERLIKSTNKIEKSDHIAKIVEPEQSLNKAPKSKEQSKIEVRELIGRTQDLMDNVKLGIFRSTTGKGGKFLEVNKAMEDITGYSREELLLLSANDLFHDENEKDFLSDNTILSFRRVNRELEILRKNGERKVGDLKIMTVRCDSGRVQYFDGIIEDITERKKAEEQVQSSLNKLRTVIKEIIQAMAYIGETRDPYTAGHQRRVANLSSEISKILGLNDEQIEGLTMAAFVHDIGKILVPADILSKPGKLTLPELAIIKEHSRMGYEILKTIEFPWPIALITLQHHERLNGSGYPSGLPGDRIIYEAKILAVADVVEAMSSHRPYRPSLGIDLALEEIGANKGNIYDPRIVDACVELFKNKGFTFN